jgi:O-antigen/teichoic acid export membrane protein
MRNTASSWAGFVVDAGTSFFLTPVLVHGLGNFYFGMWALAVSLLEYSGLFDIGLRSTIQRFIARYEGSEDRQAQDETFATALVFSLSVSAFILLASAGLSLVLPDFFSVAEASRPLFRTLVVVLGGSVAVAFIGRFFGAYLLGLQRFDLYNVTTMGLALARLVSFALIIRAGFGVLAIGIATASLSALMLAAFAWLVRRADPQLRLDPRLATWTRLKELTSFSIYVFLSKLGDQFRFNVDSLIIGRYLAVAAITPFSIATRLMNLFRGVLYGVLGPLTPAMSKLEGQSRTAELRTLFLRSTRITTLLTLSIGLFLLLNGRSVLRLWVGEEYVGSYGILVLLTIAHMSDFMQSPSGPLIFALGRPKVIGWWTAGEGVSKVLLSVYLVQPYGLVGVALGTLIPMLIFRLGIQAPYAMRLMQVRLIDYLRAGFVRPVIFGILYVALFVPAGVLDARQPLPVFAASAAVQALVLGVLLWLIGLIGAERKMLRSWARDALRAFRPARAGN